MCKNGLQGHSTNTKYREPKFSTVWAQIKVKQGQEEGLFRQNFVDITNGWLHSKKQLHSSISVNE